MLPVKLPYILSLSIKLPYQSNIKQTFTTCRYSGVYITRQAAIYLILIDQAAVSTNIKQTVSMYRFSNVYIIHQAAIYLFILSDQAAIYLFVLIDQAAISTGYQGSIHIIDIPLYIYTLSVKLPRYICPFLSSYQDFASHHAHDIASKTCTR